VRVFRGDDIVRAVSVLFIVILVCISAIFVAKTFDEARTKVFWGDETHGFEKARGGSYVGLLRDGVYCQISPAPLYYIILRFLMQLRESDLTTPIILEQDEGVPIQIREPVRFPGLSFNLYYRLDTIFYTVISGLVMILLFYFRLRKTAKSLLLFTVQMSFLIVALLSYYVLPFFYSFAYCIETRPYALWNTLWFMILALILFYNELKASFIFILLLVLLAATSSGSIYQLCALMYSFIVIGLLSKKKIPHTFKTALKIFALPILVCLYYIIVKNPHFNHPNDWNEFFRFWITKEKIPLLSLVGILLTFPLKRFRGHTIVFSTMLVLYAIAPSINYISSLRGFSFSSRSYIYYELIYPIFFISLAFIIPCYIDKITKMRLALKNR